MYDIGFVQRLRSEGHLAHGVNDSANVAGGFPAWFAFASASVRAVVTN